MAKKVFISYSQEDFKPEARFIRNYLSRHLPNSDVFIDQLKPKGSKWQSENDQKLIESDIVIIILTNGALTSSEVQREVGIAKSNSNRLIIPCKDDLMKLDWSQLPYSLDVFDGLEFEKKEELGRKLVGEIRAASSYPLSMESSQKTNPVRILGIPNTSFDLNYQITNGDVLSAMINRDASSLQIALTTYDDGSIQLTLPRILIDAKVGEQPDDLFVLANGREIPFEQVVTKENRILNIQFTYPLEELEIIGTEILGMSYVGLTSKENTVIILPGAGYSDGEVFVDDPELIIHTGEKVRWINIGSVAHTITSGTPDSGPDGSFDSSLLIPNQTFEMTFELPGIFNYYCMLHPWEHGKIIVE